MALASILLPPADLAAQRLSFIRDTETENTIRSYATPIFAAAGLNPSDVRIFLVNDKQLNAFVAGGQNLFINTGLITTAASANQVIGVIAHEAGHIAGGHLARVHDELRKATAEQIIAMVLGAAAAIATGRPDIGTAVGAGGTNIAQRSFLAYTRTQEGSADAAGLKYLDATDQSARGLQEFMETLSGQELLSTARQDPYLRTHPLTADRISAIQAHVAQSPHSDTPPNPEYEAKHLRMVAKLRGFLESPSVTLRRYPASDTSLPGRYARTIAHFRAGDLERALTEVDALIAEHPDDPYFYELKGEMLFERGRPAEALEPYETAARLLPRAPLIRVELARVQLSLNDPQLLEAAIVNLRAAVAYERDRAFAWRQLAIAYGRNGQMGESSLALAEEAMLLRNKAEARFHAGKAETLLASGSPGWLQAQDILQQVNRRDD